MIADKTYIKTTYGGLVADISFVLDIQLAPLHHIGTHGVSFKDSTFWTQVSSLNWRRPFLMQHQQKANLKKKKVGMLTQYLSFFCISNANKYAHNSHRKLYVCV